MLFQDNFKGASRTFQEHFEGIFMKNAERFEEDLRVFE